MPNLLEVLDGLGTFNTLIRACKDGGLEAMFSHEGDFTLFAPTDGAFGKLSSIELKALFENPSLLMNLILYHSVEWALTTKELSGAEKLRTLGEDDIRLKVKKKSIKIEDAQVINADIQADNGIIHVIDTVLLPPDIFED